MLHQQRKAPLGAVCHIQRILARQPEQQRARATEQHIRSRHALARRYHKLSLQTILIGVPGTIHNFHTELPISKLGLVVK